MLDSSDVGDDGVAADADDLLPLLFSAPLPCDCSLRSLHERQRPGWEGPRLQGLSDGSLGRGRGREEADTASQVSRGTDTGDQEGVMMAVRRGLGACVGSWNSDS